MALDCFSHKMKTSHLRFEGAICLQNINKGYFIYAQRVRKFFIFKCMIGALRGNQILYLIILFNERELAANRPAASFIIFVLYSTWIFNGKNI